jgi:uncharacterized membrane protein
MVQSAPLEAPREEAGAEPALTIACRALLVLAGVGLSTGLGLGLVLLKRDLVDYLTSNTMPPLLRLFVLGVGFGVAGLALLGALFTAFVRRRRSAPARTLEHLAHRLAPLGVLGFLPILFQWQVWQGRDMSFLALVAVAAFIFEAGLRTAIAVGPLAWELPVRRLVARAASALTRRLPRTLAALPLLLVCAGALGYAAYFGYYTVAWHRGVHSSFDLGLENNLMWNLIHGGQFFKSSPLVGPKGTHFGYHATLFAFVMAPIYALAPRVETLLLLQSTLLGFAAVPLFLFARLHVRPALACFIALAYLLYPGVHGANLYEFHYLPLGTFFLWTTLYALESRRNVLAFFAVLVTMSVREDVSASLAIWGAYLLLTGRRPGVGLCLAIVSTTYFVVMKMVVMPRFAGTESFTFMFEKLLPAGENTFGGVLKTAFGNPWYTAGTLLEESKLIYLLQLVVPLAFIPFRRPLALLFVVPGFLFTLLSTGYSPTISIHYQYTTYWTTFLFVSMVLVLSRMSGVRRAAAVGALGLALAAGSYQYGSILQTRISWGGPIRYKFGMSRVDHHRRSALDSVLRHLPKDAKVVGSGFITPQVSSRADAYCLTLGVYDAEYALFPSEKADFIVDERQTIMGLLSKGTFGVVVIERPFALAKRGYATTMNAEMLAQIR